MDTTDTAINLGPGDTAQPYTIPAQDWAIANKRVSVVLDPTRAPSVQAKLKALPVYDQVVGVCQTWKATTFDDVVAFGQSLATFAQTDVQSYLTVIGMIVDAMKGGDTSMQGRLDDTVKGMVSDTSGLSTKAAALAPVLTSFDDLMSQTSVETGDDPVWSSFTINAGFAFDQLGGRFGMIVQDLTNLQTTIAHQIAHDLPVVVRIADLPNAIREWNTVGEMAAGFVLNAPAQRKYLSGDWTDADTFADRGAPA